MNVVAHPSPRKSTSDGYEKRGDYRPTRIALISTNAFGETIWITSKLVRALLRDKTLRGHLLRHKELSLAEYENFDQLDEAKSDTTSEVIIGVLEGWAPFMLSFSSPVEEWPDDGQIYGTRGIYMFKNEDGLEFFSSKRAAMEYAGGISKVSWQVAEAEGYFDN